MLKLDYKFVKITYALFVFSWFMGDMTYNVHDDYKYGFWILSFLFGLMPVIYYALGYKNEKIVWDSYLLRQVGLVIVVFATVCICVYPINGHNLLMWKDLYYIIMPALYIYIIINLDQSDNLDYYMNAALLAYVAYFILGFGIQSFTLANLMSLNFADSYSPWESGMADVFGVAFFYFWCRGKKKRAVIAGFFNFLTFKRLHLFLMAFIVVFGRFLKNKPVPRAVEYIAKVALILSPMLITAICSDSFANWFEATFDQSLNSFTTGRFNQINLIMDQDQCLLGLGMTHKLLMELDFAVHRLHCDIIRFQIETTTIGLAVFVNSYINIGKRNQKGFVLMVFFFIVMFSSTCIENTYYWFLIFLCIEGLIREGRTEERKKQEELKKEEKLLNGQSIAE